MRVILVLSLFFSAAICGSLIHRQSNEPNFKERASLLLRDSKDVGPEQLNRWLGKVVPLDGSIITFQFSYFIVILCYFNFNRNLLHNKMLSFFSMH